MKRLLSVLAILCVFGLTTASFVHSAPTTNEGSPVVQGTLIIGKVQPGAKVKAEVTKDGHASAVTIVGS